MSLSCSLTHTHTHTQHQVHPKLTKTIEILKEHFQRAERCGKKTSAIVFVCFRAAVAEIVKGLKPYEPRIKARAFVGQGGTGKKKKKKKNEKDDGVEVEESVAIRGQNQREQKEAIQQFRSGTFNTLVATCIAEEGLDIGAVDLIINFDSLTSPIRMVQRRGRTGRKRTGRSVTLLTEGSDERKYRESNRLHSKLMTLLKHSSSFLKFLPSVRMVPPHIVPKMSKREMVFQEFRSSQVGGRGQRTDNTARERSKSVKNGVLSRSQIKVLDDEYVISFFSFM